MTTEAWDDETKPDCAPTERPAPTASGTFDRVEDLPSLLIDGVLWAPEYPKVGASSG